MELWLIRHGETEWSRSGQHTGRTDLPLTEKGREQAAATCRLLAGHPFALVLSSTKARAVETCRIAGYAEAAQLTEDLWEWDYGAYEGLTTNDIRTRGPGWSLWNNGVPDGETAEQVGARACRVIQRAVAAGGDVALFAHGHILRVLTACWLGLQPEAGRMFALDTATTSVLGYERETRVIREWNTHNRLGGCP